MDLIESEGYPEWKDPSAFPDIVREWFKGQKASLFYYRPISSSEDIAFALQKCKGTTIIPEELSSSEISAYNLTQLVHEFMILQQAHLDGVTGSNQDLLFSCIDGSTVEITCPCGSWKGVDRTPMFTVRRDRGYKLTDSKRCKSGECPWQVKMYPSSREYIGVYPSRTGLRSEGTQKTEPLIHPILRAENNLSITTETVELECKLCKEQGKFRRDNSKEFTPTFQDKRPRWTLGDTCPLYITRVIKCHRCNYQSALIPVDENIAFIEAHPMRDFVEYFGNFDDVVKAGLLDAWPSQRREPKRKRKIITDMEDTGMEDQPLKSITTNKHQKQTNHPQQYNTIWPKRMIFKLYERFAKQLSWK
ncbi:MAG: hypothetical protein GOMPHAMPRED_000774 [Gomphillus americanus]|uniref:Uncharacterized protein n=1 Tax=Gomphillus americanus TaxID=1940652 RepID=A0A8H3ICB4_9LECA|nr:MAG: hypothetical protein GOMPHAMPRED_000774 [Gomphillus americanus]